MATPLAITAPATARPVIPPQQTRSALMAHLLEQSAPDDMIARPPQSVGEGIARTAGMGLDALMAKKVIGTQQAEQQQKLNDFADLLEGINPELASAARKGVGLDVASQVLANKYAPKPPTEAWEPLTDVATRQAAGIPSADNRPAQRNTITGEIKFPGGASTSITMANEKAEDAERGRATVQTLKPYSDDYGSASEMLDGVKRLSGLLSTTDTGPAAALTDFVRRNTGIALTDDAGPLQGIQALVDYMAPKMRPPGSGSSSDFDARQFLSSLPSLYGDPVGNAIITQTLGGMAEKRLAVARIAQKYLVGRVTAEEAFAEMDALPDPFAKFKSWQEETGNVPKGAPGAPPDDPAAAPATVAPAAPAPAPADPAPSAIPRVSSDADYEKLAPGTVYIDPDGMLRTKGGGT